MQNKVGGTPGGNKIPEWYLRKMSIRGADKTTGRPRRLDEFLEDL